MNKKSKTAVQPLSENTRRAIIITAIIVVAVIILSVALALILKPEPNTPADNNSSSTGSSSLTIRNGDFYYTTSDVTAYPKTAQNWTRYGYKAVQGSSHDFESISTNDKAVMGIVTTATDGDGDTWNTVVEDLKLEGITDVTNPGKHKDGTEPTDDSVYMISAKEATTASILSDSFSVSSGKSVKITVWLNTAQLKDNSEAVVMLQKSSVSALAENWYAYNFHVAKADDWQQLEFHIFNRETSTKYIRMSVGLGNVYTGEEGLENKDADGNVQPITGEGTLFVDDIVYEEVTANDYRETVDGDAPEHSFKVIENEDIEDESKYLGWDVQGTGSFGGTYDNSDALAAEAGGYSPFTDRDDFFKDAETTGSEGEGSEQPAREKTGFEAFKLSHDGSITTQPIGVRLQSGVEGVDIGEAQGQHGGINTQYSLWQKDHHHISFWVRVAQVNMVAKVNIYVQAYNPDAADDEHWEDVSSGSWTAQVSSQEVDTDSNCGWVKYDVYLKPATEQKEISILVTLGNKNGTYTSEQEENMLYPNGTMYITTPAYERISSKDYNNASSGTYSKKLDLIGTSATTSITNGSFSNLNNTAKQPTGWTPAFAGDNMLYRDGRDDEEITGLNRTASSVEGSSVLRNYTEGTHGYDDEQNNVLLIKNNEPTAFGYYSGEVTLSARTVYVLSALVKGDGAHFYLLSTDTELDRADRVLAEGQAQAQHESALGQPIASSELNGWTRRYIAVMTGSESITVRLALFNGDIAGKSLVQGEAYFDQVEMKTLGSYATADDPDWEEDATDKKYIVNWTINTSEVTVDGEARQLKLQDLLTSQQVQQLVDIGALKLEEGETATDGVLSALFKDSKNLPTQDDWTEMLTVPAEEEEQPGDEEETPTEKTPVDWGLMFSVISSVALVAALLVVVVVKLFKTRRNQRRAA